MMNKTETTKTKETPKARKTTRRRDPHKSPGVVRPASLLDFLAEPGNPAIDAIEAAKDKTLQSGKVIKIPMSERKEYAQDKAVLVAKEMDNLTHIYALESVTNDPEKRYFKICMRSLLFLTVLNKKFLTRRFSVNEDSDITRPIIKGGVVTIFGLESLSYTMQCIGAIYDAECLPDNPHIFSFKLDSPVSEKMITVLRAALEAERAAANKTFTPKHTYAEMEIIFQDIEAIFTVLLRHFADFRDNRHRYLYDAVKDAADYFQRMYEDFRCVEDGVKTKKMFASKFPEQISRLKLRLSRAHRSSGISVKQYARFGKLISDLLVQYEKTILSEK